MFRERMSGPATNRMLRSKISAVSYLGDIVIYDADGELINWSRAQPLPKINVSARLFPDIQSQPDGGAGAAGIRAQLPHRQMDHGRGAAAEPPDGTFVGAWCAGSIPTAIRTISPPWRWPRARRSRCSTAKARCWRATRMSKP